MASTIMIPVEKLTGRENYNTWEFGMKSYLLHEDLWCCVEGTDTEPDGDKKSKKDIRTKSKIIMCIQPSIYVHVKECKSAKDVWDKLRSTFQDSGLTRRVSLMKKMIMTKLEECSSMEDYVNTILSTSQTLNDIGFVVSEEWVATFLLAGLPEMYRPMIMALENSSTALTGDSVKNKLLQYNYNGGESSNDAAFFSKKKVFNKGPRCFDCNQYGHVRKNCKGRNKGNKSQSKKDSKKDDLQSLFTSFSAGNFESTWYDWYIDSGASYHMTNCGDHLENVTADNEGKNVLMANNQRLPVKGTGSLELNLMVQNRSSKVSVNAMHVPGLTTNLLSVSQMTKNGKRVVFDSTNCRVYDQSGMVVATASLVDDMYKLDVAKCLNSFVAKGDGNIWHRRLGHLNESYMRQLSSTCGIDFGKFDGTCLECVRAKHAKQPFYESTSTTSHKLELVHADLCGPFEVNSIGGARYMFSLIDDFTHETFVYFLKSKHEVFNKFKMFKQVAENQSGAKMKIFRTDGGGEFCNESMKQFLNDHGVVHQTTVPHNPQQNGVAERMNRTIVEKVRSLLFDAQLPKHFWAEAANTAVYLINRSPTRALDGGIPEEKWTDKKVNLAHLRVFGSKVMVHVPDQKRKKLDPKSKEHIMVGYCDGQKGYRVYNLDTKKVTSTRDGIFIENKVCMPSDKTKNSVCTSVEPGIVSLELSLDDYVPEIHETNDVNLPLISDDQVEVGDLEVSSEPAHEMINQPITDETNGDISTDESEYFSDLSNDMDDNLDEDYRTDSEVQNTGTIRQSARIPKPKHDDDYVYASKVLNSTDPIDVDDALSRPDAEQWKAAMNAEFESIMENNTWSLSDLPSDRKPIQSKWVFKIKTLHDGSKKYKARLVIKGCAQRKGLDYEETYAPVVKYTSIRYLLALAVQFDMEINQMDAVTAFLQGELDETIFMIQPPEFSDGTNKVCRLNKALYGLKQSSRAWNVKLDKTLKDFGMTRSKVDRCIYYKIENEKRLYIAVYVDDLLFFSNDKLLMEQIKSNLKSTFKMKDMGNVRNCLGFNIERDRQNNVLWIDQSDYIQQILTRFNMADCNAVSTPVDCNVKLTKEMCPKTDEEAKELSKIPYQEAVGSLLYAAQCTRPDISYAVNNVSRYSNNPGKEHWAAIKRIFRYLKGTVSWKMEYRKAKDMSLCGYSDADWAADVDVRKSITGYVFFKGNSVISWNTRKQQTVALSTTEAEYMALSASSQEAIWLQKLEQELIAFKPITIYCDNRSAINLTSTDAYHPRTKHIDIRHHFVKEQVEIKNINVKPISTDNMVADVLTKGLPRGKHNQHSQSMGLHN